jgi:hypothetical protein
MPHLDNANSTFDDVKCTEPPIQEFPPAWQRTPRELLTLGWLCSGVAFWALVALVAGTI